MTYYSTTDFNNENFEYLTDDSSSVSTNHKIQKKIQNDLKRQDPGFFVIKRNVIGSKRVKLELYKTPISYNYRIRNAITGIYETSKVGTLESSLHFKVALCTGETGKDPAHLYFDSPEQYEFHFGVTVNNKIKSEWKHNYMIQSENNRTYKNKKTETRI